MTTPAAAEPVSIDDARSVCRIESSDTDFDAELTRLIAAARAHVEQVCGTRLATQTVAVTCDSFSDLARLSVAPLQSVSSIAYIDTAGAGQTLAGTVYQTQIDGLEPLIELKFGQYWPAIQSDSRITMTAIVGYDAVPADVKHAMLLWIAQNFAVHENGPTDDFTAFDALLINHRRGV